jgi:primary-amine oxidase
MAPDSKSRRLLGFINHAFHATRWHPDQLFAAGAYPNQVHSPDNVETWGADNESIHREDVVAWYTLGMTHVPRPEEFPVMPTARTGFRLVPKGFFDRNPALDVE